MSDDQSLGAETVVFGESLLIGLALAASCYNDFPPKVTVEFLFPAHVCFYLLTYLYKNPRVSFGRKLITPWFLIFGDLLLSQCLLSKSLPSTWLQLLAFFFLFFIAFQVLPTSLLREEMEGHMLRGSLFQIEAVYRALVLVDSVAFAYETNRGIAALCFAIILAVCRLSVPALVYAIDKFPDMSQASVMPLVRYLRTSPLIGIAVVVLLHFFPFTPSENETLYTEAHLFTAFAFLTWYGFEAVSFPEKEAEKRN